VQSRCLMPRGRRFASRHTFSWILTLDSLDKLARSPFVVPAYVCCVLQSQSLICLPMETQPFSCSTSGQLQKNKRLTANYMQNEMHNKLHYKHLPDEAHSHHDIRCQGHSMLTMICMLVLQEGESQLLIIIPPNTPLLQNPHAIRAIQLGPAAAVCPGNRQARTHASVMVLDDTPFRTADLNCQFACGRQTAALNCCTHSLQALPRCQSITQFTLCNLSCLAAAMHHMSCTACKESVCAPTVQSPLQPLLAHLQTSSLPIHPKHSSNSCRGLVRCCLSACPD